MSFVFTEIEPLRVVMMPPKVVSYCRLVSYFNEQYKYGTSLDEVKGASANGK